jgi:hypothetical protein
MERKINYQSGKPMDYSKIDTRFEKYYDTKERVEVTWKKGFEDFSGYGARSEGRKARFYVGLSIGWTPIFLQIDNTRSIGGQAILSSAVESIRGLGKFRA